MLSENVLTHTEEQYIEYFGRFLIPVGYELNREPPEDVGFWYFLNQEQSYYSMPQNSGIRFNGTKLEYKVQGRLYFKSPVETSLYKSLYGE